MQRVAWRIQAGGFVAPSSAQPLRAFARDQRVITVAAGAQHTLVLACSVRPRLEGGSDEAAAAAASGCVGAVLVWGFGRNAEAQLGGDPSALPVAEPRVLVSTHSTPPVCWYPPVYVLQSPRALAPSMAARECGAVRCRAV